MEKYLNNDEKELLSLIHYHRKKIEETKNRQGGLHPDDIEINRILNSAEEMLQSIAQQRIEREKEKQKPVFIQCPECDSEKERKPLGEEKNEDGQICNLYYCDKCKIHFIGPPNSAKDQLSLIQQLLDFFEKNAKDFENMPEEAKKDIEALKKQADVFKKACDEEEKALQKLIQAQEIQNKSIAEFRDYLLIAKIKDFNGNSPMGEC